MFMADVDVNQDGKITMDEWRDNVQADEGNEEHEEHEDL
jgi:hypothetical protein